MTPSASNTAMPATTAPVPVSPNEVMAALERLHRKTDALLTLIHRKHQP
ncbi:MAG: hypothetical protein VKI83_01490 [Synechococcaceae cyanobacterium]|nr:hypothetical protein [Synechococcaceae cyanobacterium]